MNTMKEKLEELASNEFVHGDQEIAIKGQKHEFGKITSVGDDICEITNKWNEITTVAISEIISVKPYR